MNNLKHSIQTLLAACILLFAIGSCAQPEELSEISSSQFTLQADEDCDYVVGYTTFDLMDPGYDPDWDLVVHVDFSTHPVVDLPCGHVKDEFCVYYSFEQPSHPGYHMAIRYANDQSNTIHPLISDGNQGYVNHYAEPIAGSPNFNPPYVNGVARPAGGWHKVCAESNEYYVYINFGDEAPDVPMESIVLNTSGICVVANIGTGGDPEDPK